MRRCKRESMTFDDIETFDDLEKVWASVKKTRGARQALWHDLTGSARRWFKLCRQAISLSDSHTLQSWLAPEKSNQRELIETYGTHVATGVEESLRQSPQQLDTNTIQDIVNISRQDAIHLLQAYLHCALAVVDHDHWPSKPKQALQPVAEQTR